MSVSGSPSKIVQDVAAVFPTAPAAAETPPPAAAKPEPDPAAAMPVPMAAPLPEKAPLALRPLPPVAEMTHMTSLGEVTFRIGGAKLSQQDLSRLADMIRHLENIQAQGTYVVEGYASVDQSPKRAFANATLAYDRARAVADALIFLGVEAERISVHGRSTQSPYNDGSPNRRAVVWFKQ
jgi:outer membrane protein OmpA-like peptidoglycan-associated protein